MRVAKWGNSLAVRLPRDLVERLALKAGDHIEVVDASRDRLAVERIARRAGAIERMRSRGWTLPPGYRFDREDANER